MKKDDFAEPSEHSYVQAEIKQIFEKARWGAYAERVGVYLATRLGISVESNATSLTSTESAKLSRIAEMSHVAPVIVPNASMRSSLFLTYLRLCGCTGEAEHFRVDDTGGTNLLASEPDDDWCRQLKCEMESNFPEWSPIRNGCFDGEWVKFLFPNFTTELILSANPNGKRNSSSWVPQKTPLTRLIEILHRVLEVDCTANWCGSMSRSSGASGVAIPGSVFCDPRMGLVRRTDPSWGSAGSLDRVLPTHTVDWNPPTNVYSVTQLWVHTLVVGPDAVERYVKHLISRGLAEWQDEELGATLLCMRHAIEMWLTAGEYHHSYVELGGEALNRVATKIVSSLATRLNSNFDVSPATHRQLQWFTLCKLVTASPESNDADDKLRTGSVQRATAIWSRIRPTLEQANTAREPDAESLELYYRDIGPLDDFPNRLQPNEYFNYRKYCDIVIPDVIETRRHPWQVFEWEMDSLQIGLKLLFRVGGAWAGLKAAILAWRASATPIVARDLRYWNEHGRVAPPAPWQVLVQWPIELFHHYIGDEQRADPSLEKLRGAFAEFLLKRLTDRLESKERKERNFDFRPKLDDEMLEHSPEWRFVCVRAVATLGINPDGRGHRTLHQAQFDPDPTVREAALDAYQRMKRSPGLPEGVSPRRAVLSALWWLRQGHLLALGVPIDRDGAQRTRIKELSRTREAEYAEGFEGP